MNAFKLFLFRTKTLFILLSFLFIAACSSLKKIPTGPTDQVNLSDDCISPPSGITASWAKDIYPNCYSNIGRLGKWTGKNNTINDSTSPQQYITSVSPNSIGSNSSGTDLYVIAHGWGNGLGPAVKAKNYELQWWEEGATVGGKYTSVWAWTKSYSDNDIKKILVNPNGLFQELYDYHEENGNGREAVFLGYSWVDNSATVLVDLSIAGAKNILAAHKSEAYTNLNGLRLVEALKASTVNGFFKNPKNKVHIMGHSHGSKVATVATLAMQNQNLNVNQLSLFDSPEGQGSAKGNSANLLGFYLNQMKIADPNQLPTNGAAFVDSYVSYFGLGYAGSSGSPINNMVQVGLDALQIFSEDVPGEKHSYSANYYAYAAKGAQLGGDDRKGFAWPPVSPNNLKTAYQDFSISINGHPWVKEQWVLNEGALSNLSFDTYLYANPSLDIKAKKQGGSVVGKASTGLTISASQGGKPVNSYYTGRFNAKQDGLFGLAFNLSWDGIQEGDYFIVTISSPLALSPSDEILALVIDGSVAASMKDHPIPINSYNSTLISDETQFTLHYYPNPKIQNHKGKFIIKDFSYVKQTKQ